MWKLTSLPPSLPPSPPQDFFLTIVFGVFYVLAAIAWSAGSHQLQGYVGDRLRAFGDECVRCDVTAVSTAVQVQPFTQSIVSLVS